MLRRSQRMTTRQFDEVLKRGRVVHSSLFMLRMLKVDGLGASHVAAVAPVKIAKTSVLRHRVRRRIYEAVRPLMGVLAEDHLLIILAKQPALEAKAPELKESIHDIFVKAGVLR